ncbi:MAG: hypothetical protein ACE5EG_00205 [Thermoanaerobaculia bacterium]
MGRPELLTLARLERRHDALEIDFTLDGRLFRKRHRWQGVDLPELERHHGRELLQRIYFHIAAFEAVPMAGLRPRRLDFGSWSRYANTELERLWRRVLRGTGGQWRWENGLAADLGPDWVGDRALGAHDPGAVEPGEVDGLCFNGGGKDSLVAMRLLERAGRPYATLAYSHSTYGGECLQHELIAGVERHCQPAHSHRQWVEDELWDEPAVTAHEFGVSRPIVCETPISIFAALALARGYCYLIQANERSADEGSFVWPETGEEVNHQWGKSFAAERLLDAYLRRHLLANVSYFSLLKPIWDVVIFNLLRAEGEAARDTHSCSVRKPWCETCPKCAYVGLGFHAYLDEKVVEGIFAANLFDRRENLEHYRGLLGLDRPKPFECVGEIGESRLAFELCRRRGVEGRAIDEWARHADGFDPRRALDRYARVDETRSGLPEQLARALLPRMRSAAAGARDYAESRL